MTVQDLKNFIENRPALNLSAFCRESGFSNTYLVMILKGERPLTDSVIEAVKPVMYKYGYKHRERLEDKSQVLWHD
jgi:hypothetical protein